MRQTELAKALGISKQIISARLKNEDPRKEYIRKLIIFAMSFSKFEFETRMSEVEKWLEERDADDREL